MTIPESQLQTWANIGATVTSQQTHESIRNALNSYKGWTSGVTFETYLQGSYRNSTNIRGDSDVDLVVELTSVYYSNLTEEEKVKLNWETASYKWSDFRSQVIDALNFYYGSAFIDTTGSKSVKVLPNSGRLKADVVVSANYKYYENSRVRAEGITLFTQPGWEQIVNYPKLHFENGSSKNSDYRTAGSYKEVVRIYKNSRNRIIEANPSLQKHFPSYFIECLLYNVPDVNFRGSYQTKFINTINWLNDNIYGDQSDKFECQNGMFYLFGNSTVQWNKVYGKEFVSKLIELWNNW